MFQKVCSYLNERDIHLTRSEVEMITSLTKHQIFPKNSIIMKQGKPVESLFFLNKGIVRLFRIHEGVDYTLGFVFDKDFISTIVYLLNGIPSPCALESLTEIEVLEWNREDVLAIKKEIPKYYEIDQAIIYRLLTWTQDGQIDSFCLTAEERYQKLLEWQPELLQYVPLKHIASFLAIHQDSLSRIRKMVAQKTR